MVKLKSKKGATKTETATTTAEQKESTKLQVARKDATSILDTIGFKDTRKYDNALLTKRLGKLKTYMEAWEGTLDGKTQEMVDGIIKAGPGGFNVVGEEPRKTKTGGDGKAPKAKKAKGEKKAAGLGKPGVIQTIADLVTNGPTSKEALLKKLVAKFPDRPEEGMKKTIQAQLPKRMAKERKMKIKVDKDGKFFVEK